MYNHVDKHGRKLRFKSARAFRRWQDQQAAKYIPTIEEEMKHFSLERNTGEAYGVNLAKNRKGNVKVTGPKRQKVFSQRGGDHYANENWYSNAHREARQLEARRETQSMLKRERDFEALLDK